jgi:hypothetical protein
MSDEYLLADLADLKTRLNTRAGETEDALLTQLLESASDRIRNMSGRDFLPVNVDEDDSIVRTYSAFNSRLVSVKDLRNIEVITADGTDVTGQVRLIRLDPNHPAHQVRLPCPTDQVRIEGWFGFEEVPPSIRDAVLGWAQRAYHEVRARMADSTVDQDGAVQNYFRSVPVFVSQPVEGFKVPGL